MIDLMIVEDNDIVRNALVQFFTTEEEIRVVGEASGGVLALQELEDGKRPDVMLVDLNMAEMDGLKLTSILTDQFPNIKVIILTMHSNQAFKDQAQAAGANGYMLKDAELEELIAGVKHVFNGGKVFK